MHGVSDLLLKVLLPRAVSIYFSHVYLLQKSAWDAVWRCGVESTVEQGAKSDFCEHIDTEGHDTGSATLLILGKEN